MFLFKPIKAVDHGGLILVEKRKTSSSKYVAEFALFSLQCSTGDSEKFGKLYASADTIIHPFHIEEDRNTKGCVRVLFEIDEGTNYTLCGRNDSSNNVPVILCRFRVHPTNNIPSKSTKELIGIGFEMLTKHPERLLYSDLQEHSGISFAKFLKIILEGKPTEKAKFAAIFSNILIGKSEKFVHSLENCLSEIVRVYSSNGRREKIEQLCNMYESEWDIEPCSNYNNGIDSNCKGFIAMCRIALNGNEFAKELSFLFLARALGYWTDFDHIIRSIASMQYTCITDIDLIICNFLAEFSILTMNDEVMDKLEMESLDRNISKLKSSSNIDSVDSTRCIRMLFFQTI